MTDRLLEDVNELIRLGHGDQDRLAHIKKSLENDKSLFKSDLDYVTNLITQHLSQHPSPREQPNTEKQNASSPEKSRSNSRRVGIVLGGVLLILASAFIITQVDFSNYNSYDYQYSDQYDASYVAEYGEPSVGYYDDLIELPSFVDPFTNPQYYVDRYNNEPAYKEWFDAVYPEYSSIYEAVGLDEPLVLEEPLDPVVIPKKEPILPDVEYYDNPTELPQFVDPYTDPQYYVNRYNNELAYREWFDAIYPEYFSIYDAVGLDEPLVLDEIPNPISSSAYQNSYLQEIERLKKDKVRLYAQTNPAIAGLINGNLTYYINPLPSYSTYDVTLLDKYFDRSNIEEIKLIRVYDENQADFSISWVKDYGPDKQGVAYSKRSAVVGLGNSNCGEWQHRDDWSITTTAWHEIGHVVGYGHSEDPSNVMYSGTPNKLKHDKDIKNKVIGNGWSSTFYFCNGGDQYYHFNTNKTKYDAFAIYVLPPETNPREFRDDRIGEYYICEELGTNWYSRSNECNVKDGSKIVIHNISDDEIVINGYIQDRNKHREINMQWDDDVYQYNQEYLDYIRDLFSD